MMGACSSGKLVYLTRADAKLALKRIRGKGGASRKAYRCPECDQWHLTKHTVTEYRRRIGAEA